MADKDLCLVLVRVRDSYNKNKFKFAVERFSLDKPDEWHRITVLPEELQLNFVSFALHGHSLYAVGGHGSNGEGVNIARVFDLHHGKWSELEDIKTKRFSSSCVVANNTVFVGGGETSKDQFCNSVECLHIGSRGWQAVSSTTNYYCTLQAISNRLVATGGKTGQYFKCTESDEVQLFDDRYFGWLPLPPMTRKRWWHGTLATHNGELLVAGGLGDSSIECLKFS